MRGLVQEKGNWLVCGNKRDIYLFSDTNKMWHPFPVPTPLVEKKLSPWQLVWRKEYPLFTKYLITAARGSRLSGIRFWDMTEARKCIGQPFVWFSSWKSHLRLYNSIWVKHYTAKQNNFFISWKKWKEQRNGHK